MRSRGLAAATVLVLLALLCACGYGSRRDQGYDQAPVAAGAKKTDGLDAVTIGYFPNLTHATALVGVERGLLQRELGGTRLRTAVFDAGPSEIEALNSGSIDMGWIGPSPAVNSYVVSGGRSLRIVSGSASGGVKLVVDPRKIKSLGEVRGRRIATPQLGNSQDAAFLNWIAERGWKVDPQSGRGDVSVVRTDNRITPDAFRSGAIDGAWVPEPTASKLVAEGGRVLLDESALWPDHRFVITNLVVSQRFLTAHPEAVEAVLRGSVRTNAWINAHPDAARATANAALRRLSGKALPPDVVAPAFRSIRVTDDPLAATLAVQAEHAVRAGLLDRPDLRGIYDLAPLRRVLAAEGGPTVDDAGLGIR
ncbi:aliphatic sulfonate ABC transporter substrate-binding protein [Streptomyces sp. NPDC059378]|uniref:aliphatic sulfonate ABC transporter substrate-binding protein n=1 Tax=Streptomyces sp. NPDC059378 TaxID=3346815 RepID=UPI0036BD96C2